MKVKELLYEVKKVKTHISKDQKNKLKNVLSSMFDTIERFENGGDIDSKDDKLKIEMLRDTIQSMIRSKDNESVIKGDGDDDGRV